MFALVYFCGFPSSEWPTAVHHVTYRLERRRDRCSRPTPRSSWEEPVSNMQWQQDIVRQLKASQRPAPRRAIVGPWWVARGERRAGGGRVHERANHVGSGSIRIEICTSKANVNYYSS